MGGGRNLKSVGLSDEVRAAIRRKEAAWKVLASSDEETKERYMKLYREEKRLKGTYQNKKKVNEKFGRKMNEVVNGNRKLFWKEVSNVKGGKWENCSRIKDGNGRLA